MSLPEDNLAGGESLPASTDPSGLPTSAAAGDAQPAGGIAGIPPPEVPEDLRAPWSWADLLIFFFFGLGSLIALGQLMALVALAGGWVKPAQAGDLTTARPAFAILLQALWSVGLLLYLYAIVRIRFGTPFWRTIGFREIRVGTATPPAVYVLFVLGGMVLAIGIQIASAFVSTQTKLPMEVFFQSRESVLLLMVVAILIAPLVEEVVFRGYLYPVLARSLGVPLGVLITGMLFGWMHARQLWGGWGQIGLLMVVGVVLTYARARTQTVLASYLLHLGYNSFLLLGFYVYTGGLRHLPPAP